MVPRCGFLEPSRSDPVTAPRDVDPSRGPRLNRLPWAMLLKRGFLVDVLECPKCAGRMKILAVVIAPANVRRILKHLGLLTEAPDDFYPDAPSSEW